VPFHMWTPDVYEGAPTPYTAFMAAAVKAAAFTAFLRLWLEAFATGRATWAPVVATLAAVTMVAGNLVALQQKNLKRMLAYSSIAHAGYLLVAVVVCSLTSASAFLFYLLAYTLATMGAFGVVVAVSGPGGRGQQIGDLAGLWLVRPWLAAAMSVFMLALLGFPIAGGMGFFAKWYLLQAAVSGAYPQISLAVLIVLASVVSAGYYLGVVVTMYMKPRPAEAAAPPATPAFTRVVIGVAAAALLFFGVVPGAFVRLARDSAPSPASPHAPGLPITAAPPR
jgi:NADH-quinone oxidoreductase subunit N